MTKRNRTQPYEGPLSPKLAAEVSAAALRNADRLIEDAQILLIAGRWPSAVSLAVLAIEEAAKADLVHRIVLAAEPDARKRLDAALKNHIRHPA
jgi:AbiV family abortive infection protein